MHKTCNLNIDGQSFQFDVEGEFFWGSSEVLYAKENNVISKMDWEPDGFAIVNVFKDDEFKKPHDSIKRIVFNALAAQ